MTDELKSALSPEDYKALTKLDDARTTEWVLSELKAGHAVANIGTFKIVDDEGHVEVVDPLGPPGTIDYDRFNKDGLVEVALTRVVAGDLDLRGEDPSKLKKDDLIAALKGADAGK